MGLSPAGDSPLTRRPPPRFSLRHGRDDVGCLVVAVAAGRDILLEQLDDAIVGQSKGLDFVPDILFPDREEAPNRNTEGLRKRRQSLEGRVATRISQLLERAPGNPGFLYEG